MPPGSSSKKKRKVKRVRTSRAAWAGDASAAGPVIETRRIYFPASQKMLVVGGRRQRHVHRFDVVDDVQLPPPRARDSISSTLRSSVTGRSSFIGGSTGAARSHGSASTGSAIAVVYAAWRALSNAFEPHDCGADHPFSF
jgi:hypothetical protein